jgi:hypothetical protein
LPIFTAWAYIRTGSFYFPASSVFFLSPSLSRESGGEVWPESVADDCDVRATEDSRSLVREYVEHHQAGRPHQSLGNRPPSEIDSPDPPILPFPEHIECERRLGGVVKRYQRAT